MKRRISDLLEDIRDDTVELSSETPLSSERIKELTMSKIKQEKKPRNGKRMAFRILAAAAAVSLLAMTGFAAENILTGDWFREPMNQRLAEEKQERQEIGLVDNLQETISDGQVAILNELGKDFQPQTYTKDGTTITMTAAYGYEYIMCMYFKVQAPEGTVLPDDILYQCFSHDDTAEGFIPLTVDPGAPYEFMGHQVEFNALPDEDPTDNEKDFYALILAQTGMDSTFSDGYGKHFHMTGIYQQIVDQYGDEDGFQPIVTGDFSFAIGTNAIDIPWVELDVAGMTYGGHKVRTWTHDSPCLDLCQEYLTGETDPETGLPIHSDSWDYSVTPKTLRISPYAVEAIAESESSDDRVEPGFDYQVIMKDGTNPLMIGDVFLIPIDLDQVDYILIGDPEINSTYKVYLP